MNAVKQIHWKELEVGEVYEISNYVFFEDIERLRLALKKDKQRYSLWAPDRIRYAMQGQELTHIISYGKIDGRWKFDVFYEEKESPIHS